MTAMPDVSVLLGAAALVAAALALVAAVMAWRAAERQAQAVEKLGTRLRYVGEQLDGARLARPDGDLGNAVGALRDDLSILFAHVSALTTGQLDVKKIVSAAVGRQVSTVLDRIDQADSRADERTAVLRQRLELVQEALKDTADDLAAMTTASPAPTDPTLAEALERIEAGLAQVAAAQAAPTPAAPRRAPAVFNGGRVAMLVANRHEAAG